MKTVLKVAKKALPSSGIYFGIFCAILVAFTYLAGKSNETAFSASEMNIIIQDEDATALSVSLSDYLSRENKVSAQPDESLLSDMLFYGKVDYIIYVQKGFTESFLAGEDVHGLERQSIQANMAFLDQKIELFFRYVRAELAAGKIMEEACDAVLSACEKQAEAVLTESGKSSGLLPPGYYFFTYLSYILPSVLIMVLGPVIHAFYKKDIKMRTDCGFVSVRQQNLTVIGGISLVSLLFWILLILMGILLYRNDFTPKIFLYGVLNSFLFLLVSIMISALIGMLVKGSDALNGASNLVSMGMAFLCGVFVSSEYLPDYVNKIAEFLPASWYMKNVRMLFESGVVWSTGTFFQNGAIILTFAAAVFCIILVAVKKKRMA
ncbi:MAG: ABC transporter permease [Lachnospiraceae bacterium]|nr:ABC transporter permease [Lachnospiraceae bacterium]